MRTFQVTIETSDGRSNVLVAEAVNYFYVEGIDINEVRLPKDPQLLSEIAALIPQLIEHKPEVFRS